LIRNHPKKQVGAGGNKLVEFTLRGEADNILNTIPRGIVQRGEGQSLMQSKLHHKNEKDDVAFHEKTCRGAQRERGTGDSDFTGDARRLCGKGGGMEQEGKEGKINSRARPDNNGTAKSLGQWNGKGSKEKRKPPETDKSHVWGLTVV